MPIGNRWPDPEQIAEKSADSPATSTIPVPGQCSSYKPPWSEIANRGPGQLALGHQFFQFAIQKPLSHRLIMAANGFPLANPSQSGQSMVGNDRTEQFLRHYAGCESQLRAYLMALLGNWTDVEDVFQETTLALWRSFDNFIPGTSFMTWAKQIAFHRVLQFRVAKQRRGIPCSEAFLNAVHQTIAAQSDQLESRLRALTDCVAKLTDADRKLVTMRYESNRTIKEVAAQIGRPANTLYKALERIRHALVVCVEKAIAREERA